MHEHRSYLHSKGVVRYVTHPKTRTGVRMWRYIMEYYLIARWRRCIELLETHDAVGTSFRRQLEAQPHLLCMSVMIGRERSVA